jgi:putative methanogenesis marker protein 8
MMMSMKMMNDDEHIWEVGKARMIVRDGKVVSVSDPLIKSCPIHYAIIGEERMSSESIKRAMELKIKIYGLCTPNRLIENNSIAMGYGASETLATALSNKLIDCSVIVSDGAGTVITDKPEIVQGIGMVMSGLIKTSPIPALIQRLEEKGVKVPSKDAVIDQVAGVKEAFEMGYKMVGVTISGDYAKSLIDIKKLEEDYGRDTLKIIVHSTGVSSDLIPYIQMADIVTACASKTIREIIGRQDGVKIYGRKIPVYALSPFGKRIMDTQKDEISKSKERRILKTSNDPPYPFI